MKEIAHIVTDGAKDSLTHRKYLRRAKQISNAAIKSMEKTSQAARRQERLDRIARELPADRLGRLADTAEKAGRIANGVVTVMSAIALGLVTAREIRQNWNDRKKLVGNDEIEAEIDSTGTVPTVISAYTEGPAAEVQTSGANK